MTTVIEAGETVAMPNLARALTDGSSEMARYAKQHEFDDWEGVPLKSDCNVCKGTAVDPNDLTTCMACEATGIDYIMEYGIKDSKPYARVKQYGLPMLKEYCKAMREAEVDKVRANSSMSHLFALPQYLRIDLMAAGWPVDEMVKEGNLKPLANKIAKDYPEYMTTNLRRF